MGFLDNLSLSKRTNKPIKDRDGIPKLEFDYDNFPEEPLITKKTFDEIRIERREYDAQTMDIDEEFIPVEYDEEKTYLSKLEVMGIFYEDEAIMQKTTLRYIHDGLLKTQSVFLNASDYDIEKVDMLNVFDTITYSIDDYTVKSTGSRIEDLLGIEYE